MLMKTISHLPLFLLTAISEAKSQGPIRGILIPKSWIQILSEENPAWHMQLSTDHFEINGIEVKAIVSNRNTVYIETIDCPINLFDRVT